MKKTLLAIASIAMMFTVISCGTTEEVKKSSGPDEVVGSGISSGQGPVFSRNTIEVFDYPGKAFNREIPEWVVKVQDGNYSASAFVKYMPEVEDKQLFVTSARGPNLSFIKEWTNLVDIEGEVAGVMQRAVGKALQAHQGATQIEGHTTEAGTIESIDMEKTEDMYRASLSNVVLVGLQKIADYWIEYQEITPEGTVAKRYYDYYVVYGMDKSIYNQQVTAALGQVPEATDQDSALKAMVNDSLLAQMQGGVSGYKAE